MRIILLMCSLPFVYRIIVYFIRLTRVRRFLKSGLPDGIVQRSEPTDARTVLLLLIPVLREQSVIINTIEHFCRMNLESIDFRVMIVGTCREVSCEKGSTLEVVGRWLSSVAGKLPRNVHVDYCEAKDEGGDRASQLNWAVRRAIDVGWGDWDVVGVYDADSLPSRDSVVEAARMFKSVPGLDACQQPARFVSAANRMSGNQECPLLVANALYQNTWTIISELPMWIYYAKTSRTGRTSFRHLYLIGHGEFLSRAAYERFQFPEGEVTDGIQLGYRMGFAGAVVVPLMSFCEDDVPHSVKMLVKQHKRWFGGCMNLYSAYKAVHASLGIRTFSQIVDGMWSQIRWAWASWTFVLLCTVSLVFDPCVSLVFLSLLVLYCFILPILAHRVMNAALSVRWVDWLFVPIAILIKAVGPNLFFREKVLMEHVAYEKVER